MQSFSNELVVPTDRRFLSREPATPELLNIVGVAPEWGEYIRVLDRKGPLSLLHYINTFKSNDEQTINEIPLSHVGHVRGTIVNTDTREIVCRSFPYTPEAVTSDVERIATLLPDLSKATFYNACEGTVIRYFYTGTEWNTSTHRKINADKSSWAGPTFGSMFSELRKFTDDQLDTNLCYVFLMSHDGNRLVYKIHQPQLMLIAIYNRGESRFLSTSEYGAEHSQKLNPDGCVYPRPVDGITDLHTLQLAVASHTIQNSYNLAGIIANVDSGNPHPIKIVNPSYNRLRSARGNDPSMRSRYIQLRGTPDGELIVKWFSIDPQFREIFKSAEDEVTNLVNRLHSLYINRYIKKDFSQLPKEEFVTLQRCHTWHTSDRGNNIVTSKKIREFVNSTPTHFLLLMLNRQRRLPKQSTEESL